MIDSPLQGGFLGESIMNDIANKTLNINEESKVSFEQQNTS